MLPSCSSGRGSPVRRAIESSGSISVASPVSAKSENGSGSSQYQTSASPARLKVGLEAAPK